MAKKVVTGKVRGSYVNVFRPRVNELNGKEEYSLVILIPKTDKETIQKIEAAAKEAAREKFGDKIPAKFRNPLRDGDAERPDDAAYQGHYFLSLKSQDKPGIIDRDRQPVLDAAEFVSGDYCRVSCAAYAYDVSGNKGVAFGLGNLQVVGKGEPLTARARAEDEFDSWSEDNNSAEW